MYKPIFINKPVKVTKQSVEKYVISVNGKTYKPITTDSQKQIVVAGVKYIPVHIVEKSEVGKKSVIVPNQEQKVSTFKIGNKHYIPLTIVPKVYSAIFNYKVKPVKI